MQIFKWKYVVIFCLAFSQLIGASFLLSRHYADEFIYDAHSYLQMSQGNYDVTITHRYRFIVPVAAGVVASVFDKVGGYIWKKERPKLWSERLGFLLVNTFVMSLAATVLYMFLESFGLSFIACFLGILPFLTSFHSIYDSSLPGTDSLYLLSIVWFFWALKSESFIALFLSSVLGILAKEAFLMFLPLLFFTKNISLLKKLIIVAATIATYIVVRIVINSFVPQSNIEQGISNAISTIEAVSVSLARIFSVQGVLEAVSVFTLFYIPFLWTAKNYKLFLHKMPAYFFLIFPIVLCHILLSAELPRMLLYSFPIVCLFVAFCFQEKISPMFETK